MKHNNEESDTTVYVDSSREWHNFDRLPNELKDILRYSAFNFPAHEIAYLTEQGKSVDNIQKMINKFNISETIKKYGLSHPQAK